MPELSPFKALRYNPTRFGQDISSLIAPPYDVLSGDDKAALLTGSDRNIVAVDLPFVPPKSAGPDEVYAQAAQTLQQWRTDGTLIEETQPALYVYHQVYEHGGRKFVRRKFFARLRIEAFGTGTVFPHEQTFGGPKEDRLKLMRATQSQLSAVFGLFSDPNNAISDLLDPGSREPDVTATLEGVLNKLWVVTDPKIITAVQEQMVRKAVYIADGHHRYGTALMYRDELIKAKGELPMNHPARFLLIGLCAMEDPGAVILPTHRVLSGFGELSPQKVLAALSKGMDIKPSTADLSRPDDILTLKSPYDLAIYVGTENKLYEGRFSNRAILESLAADRSKPWRKLDLAYLHTYLIDGLLTKGALLGNAPKIEYVKSTSGAIKNARENNAIALITKPCTMTELKAVSDANDLMPQKSTYFYPKLATGLVLNPLA